MSVSGGLLNHVRCIMRGVTDSEWARRAENIPGSQTRAQAACIAWFDCGAKSLAPYLYRYRRGYQSPVDLLANALETLGYPHDVAVLRAQPINYAAQASRRRELRRGRRGDANAEHETRRVAT